VDHDDEVTWDGIAASYNRVAIRYEREFLDELDAKPRDRELLTAFAAATSDPVVEIGCGPGQIGAFVRARNGRVYGIDVSPAMAALALRRLDAAVVGDMRRLPLADAAVGGIVSFYAVIHLPRAELGPVLGEFARVLRPGGRLLFSAHEGHGEQTVDEFLGEPVEFVATLFELDELVDAAHAAGLEVEIAERRPPYDGERTVRLYVQARRA
jgi:SAM-dependent methyltransferase